MDFYQIATKKQKDGTIIVYPKFMIIPSNDIMTRGKDFYAIWNEQTGLWSTDELDVYRMVDSALFEYRDKMNFGETPAIVHRLSDIDTGVVQKYKYFTKNAPDNYRPLDNSLTFSNSVTKKTDYASKKLSYPLEEGSISAYDELMSVLYLPEEREKLEWAIGAIITGDSKSLQKFIVLYGDPGSGKGTFLNIVQKLFDGYFTTFEAKSLTGNNNTFCTEVFKDNPLVAIQHDGDLSKIEDNSKLNSIISHELMPMNEKYKTSYTSNIIAFLFMGTNKAVQIPEAKSGLIRRLIDVHPSGARIKPARYEKLMRDIDFELGAIAYHCKEVYLSRGKTYYNGYEPKIMLRKTNLIYNFVMDHFQIFKGQEGITGLNAFAMFKQYCEESNIEYKVSYQKFREEFENYFEKCEDGIRIEGKQVRSYFSGFKTHKFSGEKVKNDKKEEDQKLILDHKISLLDEMLKDCPAQYVTPEETPLKNWGDVKTILSDIDTHKIHYVRPGENHIVIDLDLTDEQGNKSAELNLAAANKFPPTYSEFSKGGAGIHLHYIYDGDVSQLSRIYSEGIEIKTFTGKQSLRRRLTKCNDIPVATINSGLPTKGVDKKVINQTSVKSETNLRALIERCLRKEFHGSTKPEVDFIYKILEDAYKDGLNYDISDMRPKILAFANNSTNQAEACIKLVNVMKFKSEEPSVATDDYKEDTLIFYDVEVFPNLFVVVWKKDGENNPCVKMINPSAKEIEALLNFKLIGFNNRRYDNHIMYGRYIGYNNDQIYELSQKIIKNSPNAFFGEAYNLSYADIYDFSTEKQSLKKWEVDLGLKHKELDLPWDQPVPEEKWELVVEYCCNDVIATEATFHARKADYRARQILADLSGLVVNDTTQRHMEKIIFGNDRNPQRSFVYTDLSEMFPGYKYDHGVSTYRGEITGEGGYVYAEPGMYYNVAVLDVASMHPNSAINLNVFGPYTRNFADVKDARIAIKHKAFSDLENMLNGKLMKYIGNDQEMKDLAFALKIAINSVYGFTSAKFDNKFKDPRNKDNIVAKRGALFMIDLKHAVQELGYQVVHIKTDSIKIPNATKEIIDFVMDFGEKYGYSFEHETTYDRFCLVNNAVYIARDKKWEAVGTQFQVPYVFKTLFSKEPIEFKDLCEVKTVKVGDMCLDMNERLLEDEHNYIFIGSVGNFCPILPGRDGGILYRHTEDKYYAVTGTKGYRWLESDMVLELNKQEDIDYGYYNKLVDDAVEDISKVGDFEWFISDRDEPPPEFKDPDKPTWVCPSGNSMCKDCKKCVGVCVHDKQ